MIGLTLGRYLSGRFLRMILAVFATIFSLVYVIDFVETLRRASDLPGAHAARIAILSLLRTPAVAEQVLPFCVLFGAMAAFLNLTQKLELLVARAAGVSVWGFMIPPLVIALALGILSVAVYNPVSALMKQRADRIEIQLFGRTGNAKDDPGLWMRQDSVDGSSVMHAQQMSGGGRWLVGINAYLYGPDGAIAERIDAARAHLEPGVWVIQEARVTIPGQEARDVGTYLLATNLRPDEVSQSVLPPDSVPFWQLPELRRTAELAGLDATAYRLQFQTLLSRPLLLVAMVLIAAAFSLRFFRFGGIAKMIGGGVGTGFVLYVATKFIGGLGGSGLLSAPLAAWSPAVVASLLGALALLQQEDG